MATKKAPRLRACTTVGALIKQLERLPKRAKLDDTYRPVHYNTSKSAKEMHLEPIVGFERE